MVFSLQYESSLFEIGHLSRILHPSNSLALLLTTWSTSDTYWDDVNYTTSYLSLECNWTNFLTRRIIFSIYILKRDIHLISFEIEIGKVINRGKETTLQKDNNRCRLCIYEYSACPMHRLWNGMLFQFQNSNSFLLYVSCSLGGYLVVLTHRTFFWNDQNTHLVEDRRRESLTPSILYAILLFLVHCDRRPGRGRTMEDIIFVTEGFIINFLFRG